MPSRRQHLAAATATEANQTAQAIQATQAPQAASAVVHSLAPKRIGQSSVSAAPQAADLATGAEKRISYVLDTNVLLHDPSALFRFAEHDVYLPMAVVEELDSHKKGVEDLARNAREVTRQLAALIGDRTDLASGIDLTEASSGQASGKLYLTHLPFNELDRLLRELGLVDAKPDNQILATAKQLAGNRIVRLVTKDVNLRVKAMALSITAQDYRTDRVVSDNDLMTPGFLEVGPSFWVDHAPEGEEAFFRKGTGPTASKARVAIQLPVNSYVHDITEAHKGLWRVEQSGDGESLLYCVQTSRGAHPERKSRSTKPAKPGTRAAEPAGAAATPLLVPRDPYQAMALDLLHDDTVDIVSLLGIAGTGKTLLAVAAGLEQTRAGRFGGIVITRATVAVGEDIGFLPGTEEEKMGAWVGGTLDDCMEVLGQRATDKGGAPRPGVMPPEISIRSMSFMRGRSFQRKFIIIDEAQNLTQRQMQTLLTRAGEGTKIVLTGNTAQIDTPYLDEGSSGLVWAVKSLTGWPHAGHVILPRGNRSRLATHVEQLASQKK